MGQECFANASSLRSGALQPCNSPFIGCPRTGQGKWSRPICRRGVGTSFFPLLPGSPVPISRHRSHHRALRFLADCARTKRLLCGRLRKHVSNRLIGASSQCGSGWVPGESRHSHTHPPGLGEPRDAPDPAPAATSVTLHRAGSRSLSKPHLIKLGSAFIIHLNSESLVRVTGWFVLWRPDFFPLSPKSHQDELFRSSQPGAQPPGLLQETPA